MSDWWHDNIVVIVQDILLIGALMTAIGLGFKRVYSMARGVEKILEFNVEEKKAREKVAHDLNEHIKSEEARDALREQAINELVMIVREISRETRPNGGSSMKDVLNHTAEAVGDIKTRVAVLEEWKRHEERA